MSANCSASISRPSVVIVYWNAWPVGHRRLADLAGGHLDVLLRDRVDHVGGGQVAERHLLRVEPDPHAVVALAEVGDVAHAVQPRQLVAELDRRVVAQVEVVAAVVGREQVDDHQDAGRLLLHRHAAALDQVGQDRLGQRLAVLHQHLGHVQVDAELEGDGQRVGAVVGALRRHVHHVLDAVDLLLDRGGHGVGDHLGVGAGIVGRDLDRRRRDLRDTGPPAACRRRCPPASVMMIDSTEAKIGRSMKKRENTEFLTSRSDDREVSRRRLLPPGEAGPAGRSCTASATAATGTESVTMPSMIVADPPHPRRGEHTATRSAGRSGRRTPA